jgi:hypothetical protein
MRVERLYNKMQRGKHSKQSSTIEPIYKSELVFNLHNVNSSKQVEAVNTVEYGSKAVIFASFEGNINSNDSLDLALSLTKSRFDRTKQ